ncbi:MAG: hypothetical protein VR70_12335 [Rhodospirillaceae bacterium BRH_c57]|nr:MAG: hypothetical protein VR70_12335 [Rhodospirillaceae bacterium BRH_c57]
MNKYEIANTTASINTMLTAVDSLIRRNLDTYYTNGSSEVAPHIGLNVEEDGAWDVTYYQYGRTAEQFADAIQVEVGFDLSEAIEGEYEALREAAESDGMKDAKWEDIDDVIEFLEGRGFDVEAIREHAQREALSYSIDEGLIEHHKEIIREAIERFMERMLSEAA